MLQPIQHNAKKDNTTFMVAGTKERQEYQQAVQTLAKNLQGRLILPEDADFEAARVVWNGSYDHHPALIVRSANTAAVIAAVTFARQQGMTLSVRSGGHSMVGHGSNDDGMVIDLSGMKAISIDPERGRARIESGLTWVEVANALQPYGLALTSGDTASVGVGGLLLGGGIGWMVRKYGLTLDHLLAVELVTADGELLRASADEHPELFWGLRGGGGNFGIATAFEVSLDPAGIIMGGAVFYDASEAESVLRAYARYATTAPDELTTMALLMPAPPAPFIPPTKQGMPVVAIMVCYTGDLTEGERVVAPLRTLGTPIADVIAPMPYPVMFAFTEEATIRGLQNHIRSLFVQTLNDDLLHTIVEETAAIMSLETLVQIRVLGGAMSRVSNDATAFAHRDKQAMITVMTFGPKTTDDTLRHIRTEQAWQALQPFASGVYVNFLDDEGEQRIHDAYPPATYERLVALKNRYDPTNLFHLNQNIKPTL